MGRLARLGRDLKPRGWSVHALSGGGARDGHAVVRRGAPLAQGTGWARTAAVDVRPHRRFAPRRRTPAQHNASLCTPHSHSRWAQGTLHRACNRDRNRRSRRPVSSPFCTPSMHVIAAHCPRVHTPVMQSDAARHTSPTGHAGQEPPQSTSVSSAFWAPSSHAGAAHAPAVHAPEAQLDGSVQGRTIRTKVAGAATIDGRFTGVRGRRFRRQARSLPRSPSGRSQRTCRFLPGATSKPSRSSPAEVC